MSKNFGYIGVAVLGVFFVMNCVICCRAYSIEPYYNAIADYNKNILYVSNEKEVRKEIISGLSKHKNIITLYYPGIVEKFREYGNNSYRDFFEQLSIDNGYYMGIVSGYCVDINDYGVTFQFNYLTTKKQERYIGKTAKRIAKRYRKKSSYAKVKGVHDYLTHHMVYDDNYYNPYYAFKKGRGLCMSYSLAFQRVMQEMGIPCIYVKGKDHAWNMVKLKGKWYGVDVTWDDSGNTYKYFLKGTTDFAGHKTPTGKYWRKLRMARSSYLCR